MNKTITLAHGSGGRAMQKLIDEMFLKAFDNPFLNEREDQARLPITELVEMGNQLAFSTDSYVIDPIFFPGGNIGKIAVCGTVNDLVVGGAIPKYLSCGFIIEESFPIEQLEQIVQSMAETAKAAGVQIVTGDTKVVPRGAADKLFVNTAGIGVIPESIQWGIASIQSGDKIIVSGTLGDHGTTILNLRERLGLEGDISSDCAVLTPLIDAIRHIDGVHAVRDATRGGVTAVMHEFAQGSHLGVELEEACIPMQPAVRGTCELLGLDVLNFANEGKLVIVVTPQAQAEVLAALRAHDLGKNAVVIGTMNDSCKVTLKGIYGVSRMLDLPLNEPLPRIC